MAKFEYLELDLHGESGTTQDALDSPIGEGPDGYIAKMNKYAALGWHAVNFDIITQANIRVIMEREIVGG